MENTWQVLLYFYSATYSPASASQTVGNVRITLFVFIITWRDFVPGTDCWRYIVPNFGERIELDTVRVFEPGLDVSKKQEVGKIGYTPERGRNKYQRICMQCPHMLFNPEHLLTNNLNVEFSVLPTFITQMPGKYVISICCSTVIT